MSSIQKNLPSGFGANSTAEDVLKDISLKGKTAVVTGGNSGIGLETVKALVNAGATVVTSGRDQNKTKEALKDIQNVTSFVMDLADPQSIDRFGDEAIKVLGGIDILINNAGMAGPNELVRDHRGYEMSFVANHLGHFQLTKKLLGSLKRNAGSRVVALSSMAHNIAPFDFDDWNFEHKAYDKSLAYGQSKVATALFAVALDEREKASGLRAFSVHPGAILSGFTRDIPDEELKPWGVYRENGILKGPEGVFKTTEQGAATAVWCATSPQLNGYGGVYCADCDIAEIGGAESQSHIDVRPWAIDPEAAKRMWELSETLISQSR